MTLDEIYTIKLISGDEVVAKITAETDTQYTITKPLTVVPGPQGIQMILSVFTADPERSYSLNKSACSIVALTRSEVSDSYIEATTGIRPVSSKILLG